LTVIAKNADPSLVTQGWVGDKPCLVTADTGAYVTVARPDIADGWPERQPNQRFTLQTVSGEAFPILKEVFLTLILGRRPLKIWVFVADITEFILGLDIMHAYDASVDIGGQALRLAVEVSLWSPEPRPSSLVVAKDQVIPARCEGIIIATLDSQMHQYSVWAPFEMIAIDVAGPFPLSDQGNRYLLIAMDYFTKWLEAYAILNQEASTITQALVTNLLCRFGIPRKLHSDQGRNYESRLLQDILQCLEASKTRSTPLHP
jgi:hypothetical protein